MTKKIVDALVRFAGGTFTQRFWPVTVVAFVLSICGPALASENPPDFYGHYLQKDGAWVEIPPAKTQWVHPFGGVCASAGIEGLNSVSEIATNDQRPSLLVFQQGVDMKKLELIRLWFFKELRDVDFNPMAKSGPDVFVDDACGARYDRVRLVPFGMWTIVGTYPVQVGPVPNRPDMFRIRPQENLSPGVYAISHSLAFSSRPSAGDVSTPLWVFRVAGPERKPVKPSEPSEPPIEILRAVTAEGVDPSKGAVGIKTQFPVSVREVVGYLEVGRCRGGQVVEFAWMRPDGIIQVKSTNTLQGRAGQRQYVSSTFRPNNILMPGQWSLGISVDGNPAKSVDFTVAEWGQLDAGQRGGSAAPVKPAQEIEKAVDRLKGIFGGRKK